MRQLTIAFLIFVAFTISAYSRQVTLKTDDYTLSFAADGKPASFQSAPDHKQLLKTTDPGNGFILKSPAGEIIPLSTLTFDANQLTAKSEKTTQQVVFSVKQTSRYLLFKIEHLKGIAVNSGYSLHFQMNADPSVNAIETDYMTTARSNAGQIEISWNYLWNRNKSNPLGGFILFRATSDQQFDDTLFHIWADENIAHPKVKGDWNYQAAKQYLADWQKMFADQSQMMLEAENLDDLYAGVKYAQAADIKQIYLFTNTWRGGFWPINQGNWQLRKDVFPNGETDLRKYSDYLASNGIHLMLHYLSGSIAFNDPCYVGTEPDKRLASWGSGTLAKDVNAKDSTIYFKPVPGVELPYKATQGFTFLPPAIGSWCGFSWMRVENEIIKVGSFEQTDQPVWVLKDCKRGFFTTKSTPHLSGSYSAGLIDTWNMNFIPDNDSTLLEEIAKGYAEFCNRCRVFNVEFDGFENNCYNGLWGGEKFATFIYKNLDHPVTTGTSLARPPASFFHYKFKAVQNIMHGHRYNVHGSYSAPLMLDSPTFEAAKLLDAHYELSQGAAAGATKFSLNKPRPMFGLSVQELQKFGLTDKFSQAIRNWKMAGLLMTDDQRAMIKNSFVSTPQNLPDSTTCLSSDLVYCLHRTGDKQFQMIPVQVLTRNKIDIKWTSWQEHGPIEPKQYIKPGDSITVYNQFKSQTLNFIIRVLPATDYNSPDNFTLQPKAKLNNPTDTRIDQSQTRLAMTYENLRDIDLWQAEKLPNWNLKKALKLGNHRAIGMWVKGDNSNSVLVFQIPGRDYVVPINFNGMQYVEIPNGQVAWSTYYWGWRHGTHRTNYDRVTSLKIGFGFIPAKNKTSVEVTGLKALKEIPSELINPQIHTATGSAKIIGSIKTNQYIEYTGGNTATIYDANWNKLNQLPVELNNYQIPSGQSDISISSENKDNVNPWLETQFLTRGQPIIIK